MNRRGIALLRTTLRDSYRELFAELQALTGAPGPEDEQLNAGIAAVVEASHWEVGRRLRAAVASAREDAA